MPIAHHIDLSTLNFHATPILVNHKSKRKGCVPTHCTIHEYILDCSVCQAYGDQPEMQHCKAQLCTSNVSKAGVSCKLNEFRSIVLRWAFAVLKKIAGNGSPLFFQQTGDEHLNSASELLPLVVVPFPCLLTGQEALKLTVSA